MDVGTFLLMLGLSYALGLLWYDLLPGKLPQQVWRVAAYPISRYLRGRSAPAVGGDLGPEVWQSASAHRADWFAGGGGRGLDRPAGAAAIAGTHAGGKGGGGLNQRRCERGRRCGATANREWRRSVAGAGRTEFGRWNDGCLRIRVREVRRAI